MSTTLVVVTVLLLALAGTLWFLISASRRRRRMVENVPPGMRPAYSDEQLERQVLERYMAWGLVFTLFFAVFLPLYWLQEEPRLTRMTEGAFVTTVVRGEQLYQENCAECHGNEGQGGAAPSPYGGDAWPAPQLNNIVTRYEENRNIVDIERFIIDTLHVGRPGTPMPTWGADYGGPLTDQQIEEITTWILANQVDEDAAQPAAARDETGRQLYEANCMRCHGDKLQGVVGPSLQGVFDRHARQTILGILRNGIYRKDGAQMPPWQEGYQHKPYTDEALNKIVDYLRASQDGTGTEEPPSDEATEA